MIMVCINYWGPENVPHSGVAVQKPRLITFPFPRSLCLNSLAVNPSRHTSSSDSWETELLLFSNTTQSWPHRTISTVLFKKRSRLIFFDFVLRVCKYSFSDPHITTAAFTCHVTPPPHLIVLFLTVICHPLSSFLPVFPLFHVSLPGWGFQLLGSVSSTCGTKPTSMGAIKQTIHGPSPTG